MTAVSPDTLLDLTLAVPLLTAAGVLLARRRPNLREAVSICGALVLCVLVTLLYRAHDAGQAASSIWVELMPGLLLAFRLEALGVIFALIAAFLWLVTIVYSIGYMRGRKEANQTRFYTWFALSIAGVMGVAWADNLFTLFLFYELLTLSTYPLVVHAGTDRARKGGRSYLGWLMGTSIAFLLLAVIGTWTVAGSLEFRPGGVFDPAESPGLLSVLLVLYVLGIGKAAIMPFHRWLPAAMVAPTPVSALLHAVAVVKAGVFSVLKVCVYIFGIDRLPTLAGTTILLYLVATTILLASLVALRQDNLKARLAYSTVSQLGYISLGALLATSTSVMGSAMHMVTHAFGKITLFFCAGAIYVTWQRTRVSELRGIGRRMPLTMAAFFLASLSIIGLPPGGGTWSKWFLLMGTLDSGHWILMAVLMLSTLLNLAYLLPITVYGFLPAAGEDGPAGVREAPLPILLALTVTTLGCIGLFLFPQPLLELATAVAVESGATHAP